jgi:hypothetical protein
MYLEDPSAPGLPVLVSDGEEVCACRAASAPRPQLRCVVCLNTGRVPSPFFRETNLIRAQQLVTLLRPVILSRASHLPPQLMRLKRADCAVLRCGLRLMQLLSWGTVPVSTFVYPHEWLLFRASGKPPVVRTVVDIIGHERVLPEEMPRILHRVGDVRPGVRYYAAVTWNRVAREHFPAFVSRLESLQSTTDADKVRAVFWMT